MTPVSDHTLQDRVLQWVLDSVDAHFDFVSPRAAVQSVHRLKGSTSSNVHSISIRVGQVAREFILRQFDNMEWLREEPDLALHEAKSLRNASRTGLPTPKIVAFDESGYHCGVPAVLMTYLEGSVVLRPGNKAVWLDGLAESLVRIHAVEADDFPWSYFAYNDISSLKTPTWSNFPEAWSAAVDFVRGPRPKVRECFIHRDYHPANVLWTQSAVSDTGTASGSEPTRGASTAGGICTDNGVSKVSGVVDWVNACRGPRGIDIGHCRVNLAQLFDVPTADAFLSAYKHHAGPAFSYDPYWDILTLFDILSGPPAVYPGWAAFGVTGLTDELMVERLDAYMKSLVARV